MDSWFYTTWRHKFSAVVSFYNWSFNFSANFRSKGIWSNHVLFTFNNWKFEMGTLNSKRELWSKNKKYEKKMLKKSVYTGTLVFFRVNFEHVLKMAVKMNFWCKSYAKNTLKIVDTRPMTCFLGLIFSIFFFCKLRRVLYFSITVDQNLYILVVASTRPKGIPGLLSTLGSS